MRSGPRSDGTAATGHRPHSMHGILAATHSPRQTCRNQVLRHGCTDGIAPTLFHTDVCTHVILKYSCVTCFSAA